MDKPNDTNDNGQHHNPAALHRTATRSRVTPAAHWMWMTLWMWLRHPINATFHRLVVVRPTGDTWAGALYVYGNFEMPAYSGVVLPGVSIEGDADGLRALAVLLLDRADRVAAVQTLLDAGVWPDHEDSTGFPSWLATPDGVGRLGDAVLGDRGIGGAR
ncbi:hypothetical protein [Catenulispora rubra]|uniref:hypothetical protein n=1 Tax=Catenulispora rubra TaxID=280293 RepID=UPI001891F7B8|nr:hypothetical protein [Catenulispora rubra]